MDISLTQGHFYMSKIRIMSNNRTNNGLNNTKIYLVCSEMFVTEALNKFGTPIALCAVSIPDGLDRAEEKVILGSLTLCRLSF